VATVPKVIQIRRWPVGVEGCSRCAVSRDDSSYGRRGLCASCNRIETRNGTITSWPTVSREKYSYRVGNSTADGYWLNRGIRDLYRVVSHIGATEAAHRLGVERLEIIAWMNGKDIPGESCSFIKLLREEIKKLTKDACVDEREEEFFESEPPEIILYDGRYL